MSFSGAYRHAIKICYRAVANDGGSAPAKCGFAGDPTSVWGSADITADAKTLHFRHTAAGQHSAHAAHHFRQSAFGGGFFHLLLHLLVLLDQASAVLHLGTGS